MPWPLTLKISFEIRFTLKFLVRGLYKNDTFPFRMANIEILNKLEKDRLKDLNDRTVCIHGGQADKPTTHSLLTLGLKHQSIQRIVKSKQAYIFIIFGNLGIKLSCELNEI